MLGSIQADHKKIISELRSDNINLIEKLESSKNWPKIDEWKFLLKKIEKLKEKCENFRKEKERLSEELEKVKKELPVGSLSYFVQDIWKIRKEVFKLARVYTISSSTEFSSGSLTRS